VQQLFRHKSPIITQRYAHHYPKSLRDGMEILDRLAGGRTFGCITDCGAKRKLLNA
jgi:hypothetical protein